MLAAVGARAPVRALDVVGDWVLGEDATRRRALKRWALTAQCYVVALYLLFQGAERGLTALAQAQFVALYCGLGMSAFYLALRTGWSAKSSDPMLAFPMALFSASAIVLSYELTEISRAASLQLLFLLVVFEMRGLSQRQTNIITFGATGMLLVLLTLTAIKAPAGFNLRKEIFNMAMAAVMLPVLSLVAREVRHLRRRQMAQRADLESNLLRLRELSIRDPLTGLFNRRNLLAILEAQSKRQLRSNQVFHIAIVDLDLFKGINDQFGHQTGDAVLRDFAKIASQVLRSTDAIGRWGGEEFAVLLLHADTESALRSLDRLRTAITQHDWNALAAGLQVSFSAGVCPHWANATIAHTLEQADAALYAAKAAGRNRTLAADTAKATP